MTQDPRSYTTIDVAKRIGVSLQTVQRWVDAGHLKAWKTLGGHRRIEAASAELLFKEQEDSIGATESSMAESGDLSIVSVVVVDDNAIDLEVLVMLVRKAIPEATVEGAGNGFQGLVAIGKLSPQIVITDIQMPNMNGIEMIRALLQDAAARPRTLIAVSALSRHELSALGTLPAGVQVFNKPLDQDRFVAALLSAGRSA